MRFLCKSQLTMKYVSLKGFIVGWKTRAVSELHNHTTAGEKGKGLFIEEWKCVWGLCLGLLNETLQTVCCVHLVTSVAVKRNATLYAQALCNEDDQKLNICFFCVGFSLS